jgi:hypothetical protein
VVEHLTFNQGVTGSSPVRPKRLNDGPSSDYTTPRSWTAFSLEKSLSAVRESRGDS